MEDMKSIQETIQAALIATTKTCGVISAEDLSFQRQLDDDVSKSLDEQSTRLLSLSRALLKSAASIADLRVPVLEDMDDLENNWRGVVDVVDSLLEKTDICLDEYTGARKRKEDSNGTEAPKSKGHKNIGGNSFRNQNLVKPQLAFDVKPDNENTSPWRPLLRTKPHAVLSLDDSLGSSRIDDAQQQYPHPYETEITNLKYPETVYKNAAPIAYQPMDTTSATFVDTLDGVMEMLEELKAASEIAVDLEHHDSRSYVGLTSLMQISTRTKDWIVDTLKPWRQELQVLNEVFADPKIIKVFHGAYMDIVWLQRDLGLYVVGLFDTHHACRTLGYEGGSLAFLLKKWVNFDADKKYQLADWRIRPIPEEMYFYARADTHFLLYIFDNVRNELVERTNPDVPDENRIEIVLQKSKETSLLRYERQVYDAENGRGPAGWWNLLNKNPSLLNNQQFAVFKAVHAWRDKISREDDESTQYVLPNHVLFTVAKIMPMDMIALVGITHSVSYSAKSRLAELLELIQKAKAEGKDGPSMINVLNPKGAATAKASTPPAFSNVNTSKTLLAVEDDTKLVSTQSSFWGGAFGSSLWDSPLAGATIQDLKLAVPLPKLSDEIFAAPPSPGLADRSRNQQPVPSPPSSPQAKPNEPFTLRRGNNNKRKTEELSADEEAGEYDISLNDPDPEEAQSRRDKALAKAEKKERKRQKKLAKAEAEKAADGEEEGPFDYTKAASVLHAKPPPTGSDRGGKKKKTQPFDPYSKSQDTATGLRRLQSERPGRSHTFKK